MKCHAKSHHIIWIRIIRLKYHHQKLDLMPLFDCEQFLLLCMSQENPEWSVFWWKWTIKWLPIKVADFYQRAYNAWPRYDTFNNGGYSSSSCKL